MSGTRSRTRRTFRVAITLVLGALLAALLPMASAHAGKPQKPDPAPVTGIATRIEFTDVSTVGVTLPTAPGATGLWYAVAGEELTTTLEFLDDEEAAAPLSANKTVTVTVSYGNTMLGSVDVAPTVDHATVELSPIDTAVSGITLSASAATKPRPVTGTSDRFDVLIESERINSNGRNSIGGAGGTDTECNATPEEPICADLIPPVGGSFGDGGLFSRGVCLTTDKQCLNSYVQAIAAVNGASETNPATLIMKCDKVLCGGGAIKSKKLTVNLTPADPGLVAPDCPAKGTVGSYDPASPLSATNSPFCVDYVQSTRDNAGDTILYLLFLQDAKVRFS